MTTGGSPQVTLEGAFFDDNTASRYCCCLVVVAKSFSVACLRCAKHHVAVGCAGVEHCTWAPATRRSWNT